MDLDRDKTQQEKAQQERAQQEKAQQTCLKLSFGGSLDQDEQDLLRRYLATEAGQRYMADATNMQRQLRDIAEVRLAEPVDGDAIVRKFEAMAREQLLAARRWLPLQVLLTVGGSLLAGGLCLWSGRPHLVFFGWMMLGWAALFAMLFVAIGRKTNAWMRDPDLLARMDEDRRLGSSLPVLVTAGAIAITALGVLCAALWQAGGTFSLSIGLSGIVVSIWASVVHERRKRRENQELWDWWDGTQG